MTICDIISRLFGAPPSPSPWLTLATLMMMMFNTCNTGPCVGLMSNCSPPLPAPYCQMHRTFQLHSSASFQRPCPAIPAPGRRERDTSSRVFGVSSTPLYFSFFVPKGQPCQHPRRACRTRRSSSAGTVLGSLLIKDSLSQIPASVIASCVSDEAFIVGRYCDRTCLMLCTLALTPWRQVSLRVSAF